VLHLFTWRNVIKSLYLEGAASCDFNWKDILAYLSFKMFAFWFCHIWHFCLFVHLSKRDTVFDLSLMILNIFVCLSLKKELLYLTLLIFKRLCLFCLSVCLFWEFFFFFVKKIVVHCFWNSCLSSIKINGNEKDWYLLQKFKELLWTCWLLT
jgi:hypothetical protein